MEKDTIYSRRFIVRNAEMEPHEIVNEMENTVSKGYHHTLEMAEKEYYALSPKMRHIKAIWCVTKSRNDGTRATINA